MVGLLVLQVSHMVVPTETSPVRGEFRSLWCLVKSESGSFYCVLCYSRRFLKIHPVLCSKMLRTGQAVIIPSVATGDTMCAGTGRREGGSAMSNRARVWEGWARRLMGGGAKEAWRGHRCAHRGPWEPPNRDSWSAARSALRKAKLSRMHSIRLSAEACSGWARRGCGQAVT